MTNVSRCLLSCAPPAAGRGRGRAAMLALLLTAGWAGGAAAAGSSQATITIKLTVTAPPCEVVSTAGGKVEVNFGSNIGINKIDGVNYRQPMNYAIKCGSGDVSALALKLTLKGTAAGFDSTKSALKTNIDGLGIRIYQNNTPFVLNQPITITKNAPPQLEAVPIKQGGAALKEGAFEATATLLAEYE